MNPRQNALGTLSSRWPGIHGTWIYEDLFALFGRGPVQEGIRTSTACLRRSPVPLFALRLLGPPHPIASKKLQRANGVPLLFSRDFGDLAWLINVYIDWVARVREAINALLGCRSLDEQRTLYTERLHAAFWTKFLRWIMDRDLRRSKKKKLFGSVPRAQRRQVENSYPGGIAKFIEDRLEAVFTRLPLADNYFWRLYLTGQYTSACCLCGISQSRRLCSAQERARIDCVRVHTGAASRISWSTTTGTISAGSCFWIIWTGSAARTIPF